MARQKSSEVEEAGRVLRAAYYQSVSDEVADLVRAYFDGEYDDEEGQQERLEQAYESAVTYTHDAYSIIYNSERSSEGYARWFELNGQQEVIPDNDGTLVSQWAYWTFEADVRELLGNSYGAAVKLLAAPMEDGLGTDTRLVWLADNFGTLLFEEGDVRHFYVGVVDAGTATEVDLGIVTVKGKDGGSDDFLSADRRTVPAKFDALVGENRDPGSMRVLRDALLEAGFFSEKR